jgi:predicted CXXCH cytochrome family protein
LKILLTTKSGSRAPMRKTVTGEWLRVGRKAASEIHLPDPRVPLEQGLVVFRNGLVYIEGEAGAQNITRKSVRSLRLEPGASIDIGPYRMQGLPTPPGFDGALLVELVQPLETSAGLAASELTLASLGLTKRRQAWFWGIAVLLIFLLVPAGRVLDLPWRDAAVHSAFGDRFWNPGPLILAHQPIEARCGTCHEVAFEHVKDRACLECHRKIGHHVGPEFKPAVLFEGARCASCHRDHKGTKTTHRDDDGLCVRCHADIKSHGGRPKAVNASDFAHAHPDLKPRTRAESNLKFPHAVHLDPKGVKSPTKGRVNLECAACHQPDASKRAFEPISMGKHCQECHTLKFEPAVTAREVPHGKPAEAVTVIDEFYANLALNGVADSFVKAFGVPGEGLLRRVGEPSVAERQAAAAMAHRKSQTVAKDLFEVRVCKTCHEVGLDWSVAEVRVTNAWMPQAHFDHRAHAQTKCAACHDVAHSKKASDVAMPAIGKCRECHGGSRPVEARVTSNCLLCHNFHDATHPWSPGFKPRPITKVAGAP